MTSDIIERECCAKARLCDHWVATAQKQLVEISRLRAHYADEQQRLFHYERVIAEQRAEIEQLKASYTAANGEELPKGAAGTTIVNDGRPT